MEDDRDTNPREEITELVPDRTIGLGVLVVGWLVLLPPLFTASPADRLHVGVLIGLVAAVAALIALRGPTVRATAAQVALDDDTVVITRANGRRRRVRRARIDRVEGRAAIDGKHELVFIQRWRTIRLELADRERAVALARRLGLHRSAARYWVLSPMAESYLRMWGAMLVHFFAAVALSSVAGPLAAAVLVAWPIMLMWPTRSVTVGEDGIEVHWMGSSRYIPFAEMTFASVIDAQFGAIRNGVRISFGERDPMRLPTVTAADASALADAVGRAIGARSCVPTPLVLASRGERSFTVWVAHLRRPDAASLRNQAVSNDELWRAIEDAAAPPIERGAAAVALGTTLASPERARLAEIARTVAAPKLRVVLERSIDADDDALGSMLEHLEVPIRRAATPT